MSAFSNSYDNEDIAIISMKVIMAMIILQNSVTLSQESLEFTVTTSLPDSTGMTNKIPVS